MFLTKILLYFNGMQQKTWGAKLPMPLPALAVTRPIMTCTKWQVGCRSGFSLLPTSTQCQSMGGRSAIQPGSLTSLDNDVGPTGHIAHRAGGWIIRRPLRLPRKADP